MLPSKGYFSNLSCPFFEIDSCDRPHCHFKHSKKDKDIINNDRINDSVVANENNDFLIKQLVKETVKQVLNHSEIRESNESIIDTNSIVEEVVSNLSNQNINNVVSTTSVTSTVQTSVSSSSTPSYRPTPISELSRRHIPVQYAPAKPTSVIPRKISDKSISYIPTNKSDCPNNETVIKSSLNPLVSAYIPVCSQQLYQPEYLPTKINSENFNEIADDGDDLDILSTSSSPSYHPPDIQPPDSPLTYTPQSNSTASCSYHPSPIKEHTVIINSEDNSQDGIDADDLHEIEFKKIKSKESRSKHEKSGHSSDKTKSDQSSKKDKQNTTNNEKIKTSSLKKSKSDDKLKEINKDIISRNSSKSSHNHKLKSHDKTSIDKIKSKDLRHKDSSTKSSNSKSSSDEQRKHKNNNKESDREIKYNTSTKSSNNEQKKCKRIKDSDHKIKHNSSSKSSNDEQKKYKNNSNKESDRENKHSSNSKISSDEQKKHINNKETDREIKYSSCSKSSNDEQKKHKNSNKELDRESKHSSCSKSSSNDKKKYNNINSDDDIKRKTGDKRKHEDDHKLDKKLRRAKRESYSSSSDVELVSEKSPCILINDSSNSSDEETDHAEKKPKLSVSGGSLPFQNLGPSTSRLTLPFVNSSFSERWRKAKEQVQRPHTTSKIKICSVPNVSSLLTAKDKLLALAHKPTQPVQNLKLNSSEHNAQPAVKQRIAHKAAIDIPKCLLDPAIKLPYATRQLCLNTMYEVCLQYLPENEAKELALSTEFDIAKRVNIVKTYQNSMALAVLKIRKTKGEDGKKEEVEEGLTAQSIPEYTYGLTLYECFSKYLLNKDEIIQNGYPLAHPTDPGCAYIDPSARRYTVKQPDDPYLRICLNCKKHYYVDDEGYPTTEFDCFYHHGKVYRVRGRGTVLERYRCCQAEVGSDPCVLGRYHICSTLDEDRMPDFITTTKESSKPQIYGLDCEMCYTKSGLELARCTMLGLDGKVVIDTTVLPSSRILDYCTRYSGLTEQIMSTCTTTFDELRETLMKLIHKNTIIVGHSLENDFKVMKIIHNCVVDTSVVFPHKMGPPVKNALRSLVKEHLRLNIQQSEEGHDSREDALAAIDLMIWKVKEDSKKRKPRVIISLDSNHKESK